MSTVLTLAQGQTLPTVTWTRQPSGGPDTPGWTSYLSLHFDPVSRSVLTYAIRNTASGIYSTDMFARASTVKTWKRLGGTGTPNSGCNDGSASDVQPWPPDRHPVEQMAVDTRRNRLWLYNGVSCNIDKQDMWYYTLNADPTQDRWTKVPITPVPTVTNSGGLIYSADDDVLVLVGPNTIGNNWETWVFCPATPLSPAQAAAGCKAPNTWIELFPAGMPVAGFAGFPMVHYDPVRKVVTIFAGDIGNVRAVHEYRIPSQQWTTRTLTNPPAESSGCCPEQTVVYISSGPFAGKFWYHQTAHSTSTKRSADYLYDPTASRFDQLATNGVGPEHFSYHVWDPINQVNVGWAYGDDIVQEVWHGTIGEAQASTPPPAPTGLRIIK